MGRSAIDASLRTRRLTLPRELWQVFSHRLKQWAFAVYVLTTLMTVLELGLIALLGAALSGRGSSRTIVVLVLATRIALGVLWNLAFARLGSVARSELQLRLWHSTLTPRGFDVVQASPSTFVRVLNQAPTDVSLGVLVPGVSVAADATSLALVGCVGLALRPLTTIPATVGAALVAGLAFYIVTKRTAPASMREALALEAAHRTSWDVANGVRDIVVNRAERGFESTSRAEADRLASSTMSYLAWSGSQRTLLDTITLTVLAFVALFSVGNSAAFVGAALLLRLMPVVARLGANSSIIANAMTRVAHWRHILSLASEDLVRWDTETSSTRLATGSAVVRLCVERNVAPDRLRASVLLVIERAEWIQLAGPSGAGKSSILDAISGLWRPAGAEIELGVDRKDIGYASQSPFLISASIADNVALGRGPRLRDVLTAGSITGLDEVFGTDWLEHQLTDRGANVSGGQIQRISLARALVNRPELLLLDEATANLDIESERSIFERLRARMPETCVVLVTHRPPDVAWPIRVVNIGENPTSALEAP